MDKTLRPDSKTIRATERKSNVSPTERTLRPNEDRTIRKAQRQTGGEKKQHVQMKPKHLEKPNSSPKQLTLYKQQPRSLQ